MAQDELYDRLFDGTQREVLPAEVNRARLDDLDAFLARQQTRGIESVLGDMENRGFLRSGESFKNVAEQVLGPAEERRRSATLDFLDRELGLGREERLAKQQFDWRKELAKIDLNAKMDLMNRQSDIQRGLLFLQKELEGGDGGFGWEEFLGTMAGVGAGAATGGAGAGIGKAVGRKVGSWIDEG